ncbi:hypothetical protein WJ47_20625 [Burkholderia ubonensis]|uniref:DUF2169 domain-containing protein n=1 Tax=Burkholderia ubonensis TaxID=101571 RepID=A0AB73G4T9_9BURK|nr:DUF2169 domain-containing protein [Burkholderia ubonensis]KVC78107.1 hypothetical protein WI75_13755 [Burkholderia ubonensis]KVK92964.1 hypothetical protein WJ44_24020 [Burkholderia ubonensis]KVL59768.1 hypothetical protein WJ47_20625 [Burkholderia ubonensis]KVM30504.1 hypothetical protein WJ53_06385 [Burkholderia ubonensis]KVM39364.1 hypothetical protein WJ54_30425 [Burkholderia ubonensis]
MWELDNRTPFAAQRAWIRDRDGAEVWVVAVKATYDILPDGCTSLSHEQVPVHAGPVPHPESAGLLYDTDLGPAKPATDIVLNGHAWAPAGQPVTELAVEFTVGSLTRRAKVIGDRFWEKKTFHWKSSKPAPFLSMPLVYERAFGGKRSASDDAAPNPVGRGIQPDEQGRIRLPNIESLKYPVERLKDRPPVVGFAPIPSHWAIRRQYAGTYDQAWLDERFPLPPADLDARFWQCAPPEQQVSHLKGGETISLLNLTPPGYAAGGRLTFTLPKVSLGFQTHFYGDPMQRSRAVIHSLILEPDFPRVSVVHHMSLPCHPQVNRLSHTRIIVKSRPLDRRSGRGDDGATPADTGTAEGQA